MISKDTVYARIKQTGNLPTLPEILIRLIEVCDDETVSLAEVAAIISTDPALSFKVLQLVNSSYYGLRSTFTGIEQAVVYLGANSVKNIAVTTSVHQVFDRSRFKAVEKFNLSTFWYHSLMSATLARRLAVKTGFGRQDEAYLSGLLHDIGRLILVSSFPREHESILLETEDVRNQLWAETQLIGITHCEAGSWLVRNWKLNSLMADAVRCHHDPLEQISEAFPLVKIVYVSNLLGDYVGGGELCCEAGEVLLGLDEDGLIAIVEGATEEVAEIAENLGIDSKPPPVPDAVQTARRPDEQEKAAASPTGERQSPDGASRREAVGEAALTARIKSFSLLTTFFENMIEARDSETILTVFEESVGILFGIERVLFFLPDQNGVLLKGHTSPANSLHRLSQGLALPIQRSSSLAVKVYLENTVAYLSPKTVTDNLADEHLLSAFGGRTVFFVPIVAENQPAGLVLLGLPVAVAALSPEDTRLIRAIAQQVGLCLHLERMKAQRAEEIERERMAAVSMTARKLAHEINNPLGIISNYLTTMTLKLSKETGIQEEIGIIGEEIQRISAMINQMDKFSQPAVTEVETTAVNAVIEDVIQIVRPSLFEASAIAIVFRPEPSLPEIMASRDALKQIVINLLKNAAEAMSGGGRVEVRTRLRPRGERAIPARHANLVEIIIEDTGPGLPESIMANLYKPFATTKQSGHSGLGLSIVYKMVTDLGGVISCASKAGAGTRFTISLPAPGSRMSAKSRDIL